jgi:hypothetical protein
MAKSIRDIPKKRPGRPSTGGRKSGILVRLPVDQLETLDAWIGRQDDEPSRPEAIRRLVELGLTVKPTAKPSSRVAARAAELAAKVIDKRVDPAAPAEEQASRKKRLLKGPEAFREVRVDRTKAN